MGSCPYCSRTLAPREEHRLIILASPVKGQRRWFLQAGAPINLALAQVGGHGVDLEDGLVEV